MELHFCARCGISIPLTEVQAGVAGTGDGRYLCSEHRTGAKAPPAAAEAADVELMFCANCKVSIPAGDVDSGRARREFGSLLCAACSAADAVEKDRRRRAVEAEMAADTPSKLSDTAESRRCAVCATVVPQTQIAAGRALVQGDRIVCPRCREAGAVVPAGLAHVRSEKGAGVGTVAMMALLGVALVAAGFFGVKYFEARNAPPASAAPKELADLRRDVELRMDELRGLIAQREIDPAQSREALDAVQLRLNDTVLGLREDLAEVRTRLTTADGDLAQRLARLEGQVSGLSEMIKGLAARPSAEPQRTPPPPAGGPTAGDEGGPRVPEGPAPEPPKPPEPGVSAEVTKLVKDMLEASDPSVRFPAAIELRRRKERAAISPFCQVLTKDENVMVRRCAAAALGEIRAWNAVPVLIQALEDKEAYVAQTANFAIQSITGQDFGVTMEHAPRERKAKAATAAKWWKDNKDSPPEGVVLEPVVLPGK